MNSETAFLDDRFLDDVWYDMQTQDFVRFQRTYDGEVTLHDPITGDFIEELPEDEFDPSDFTQILEGAVENPAAFMETNIYLLTSGSLDEFSKLTHQEIVSLRFANNHTKIVSTLDDNE